MNTFNKKQISSILSSDLTIHWWNMGLKSETEKRINEYQSYWPNRSVRVVPNKKYKPKN